MMKQIILTSTLLLSALLLFGQSKISIQKGFWMDKYTIGDKPGDEKDLLRQFKEHNAEAYHQFKSGRNDDAISFVAIIVALGGTVALLTQTGENRNDSVVTAGAVSAGLGLGVSILFSSTSKRKKRNAIDLYNSGL